MLPYVDTAFTLNRPLCARWKQKVAATCVLASTLPSDNQPASRREISRNWILTDSLREGVRHACPRISTKFDALLIWSEKSKFVRKTVTQTKGICMLSCRNGKTFGVTDSLHHARCVSCLQDSVVLRNNGTSSRNPDVSRHYSTLTFKGQ